MLILIQPNPILIRPYNNDVPDILLAQLNRLYCCIKIACMVNTMCLVTSARPYTSGISRTYGLVDDSFGPAQALRDVLDKPLTTNSRCQQLDHTLALIDHSAHRFSNKLAL